MVYKGSGSDIRWDDEITGLGCRIYPSGKKSFVVSYRFHGRKQLMVLGQFGRMSMLEARRQAKLVFAEVVKDKNPLERRKQELMADTVKELCISYMERHGSAKKTAGKDQSQIDRHILPAWKNLKAADIKRSDVATLHGRMKKTPYEANRVLALISVIFKLARVWGFVPEDNVNPARDVPRFKEHSRDRYVSENELPKLIEAIDAEDNEFVRAAFHLYLLTGMRKSELLNARWDDIDWERRELRLADTKAGRVHYVPLTAPALAVLEALPRLNEFVLYGATGHLTNINRPWNRIRKAAGLDDVRIHDLRRTVGSWLAMSGNSLALIGKVLGHSNVATTQVYARFAQDAVRDAMDSHATQIENVGKGETATILPLKRGEA